MTELVTRFAPSPTGNLHIGSARTALINFILKSQYPNSKLYLRIEDTDKQRSKEEYINNILNGLKWLGISWDNEPQIQSKNINRHLEIANELLKIKKAYKCACTENELSERRRKINSGEISSKKICINCESNKDVQSLNKGFVIRIKIPEEGKEILHDVIQGKVEVNKNELDDFVLIRQNNTPTYMLSVVVDDHDLGVNYIIRGDDHLNNYFRQKFIYEFLSWEIPRYAHIPLINGEDGKKLSKRHGAVSITDLKKQGFLAEAIINNLILLGWAPNNQKNEIINLENIINEFKINNLSKSSSIFSYKKLNFFNNHYIKQDDNLNKFYEYCKSNEFLNKYLQSDKNKITRIFKTYKKNILKYEEMINISKIYFDEYFKIILDKNFDIQFDNLFKEFLKLINNINTWEHDYINLKINEFLNQNNIKFPVLGKPVRYLLTNNYNGPSITDIFMILGKNKSLERLNNYKILNG